ncbi:adenylate kinase [Candidatus Gracilibacteria bacterium]|nr:adenylate kinase [Candidatus Gracilibacteria bacterium]
MKIILLGAPGVGKGTVAKILSQKTGSIHFSTGQFFRKALKSQTELGLQIKNCIETGDLVPDNLVKDVVENELLKEDYKKGFILDGFPRTVNQAIDFNKFLAKNNLKLDFVASLDIPFDVIIERIMSRRTCSDPMCQEIYNLKIEELYPNPDSTCKKCGSPVIQRDDETEKAIKFRLEVYNQKTAPLIDFYKKEGNLLSFDSTDTVGVAEEIIKVLNSR